MRPRLVALALLVAGCSSDTPIDPPAADAPDDPEPDGSLVLAAAPDLFSLDEDGSLEIEDALGVLANDTLATSAVLEVGPTHGTLTLATTGSFVYTPEPNYFGPDGFTYRASDGNSTTEPVAVTIAVVAIDDPPIALADQYLMNEDTSLAVPATTGVLANDVDIDDPLGAPVVVAQPNFGTLTLAADGSFTYVPAEDFSGIDGFTYAVAGIGPIEVELRVENTHDTTFARRSGGSNSDEGVVTAQAGLDTWVGGTFRGTAQFDALSRTATNADLFLTKHSSGGPIALLITVGCTQEMSPADIEPYPDGGIVVAGTFRGTATFGAGEPNETVLTSTFSDPFVARFSSTGALVWARFANDTSGNGFGSGVAVGKDGEVYITGDQDGTMTFSPGRADQIVFAATGTPAFFVARYEADGTLTWVKGGAGSAYGESVDTIADGSLVVVGGLRGGDPVTLGVGEATETTLPGGNFVPFVARLETTGALRSARRVAEAGGLEMTNEGVFVAADGAMFLTGVFTDTVTFGEGEANETTLTPSGFDTYIAAFAADGTLAWARGIASIGSSASRGYDLVQMSDGGVVVVGHVLGTQIFGAGDPNETTLTSTSVDIFYARYRANGQLRWAKRAGGTGFDEGRAVSRDQFDQLFITGLFGATGTFGIGDNAQTSLTSAGGSDMFVFGLAL